eukprot:4023327-Ditylum_brightwellii.AAC.1
MARFSDESDTSENVSREEKVKLLSEDDVTIESQEVEKERPTRPKQRGRPVKNSILETLQQLKRANADDASDTDRTNSQEEESNDVKNQKDEGKEDESSPYDNFIKDERVNILDD